MSGRIVIVGAGVAGATAAKTLRAEGYSGEIVLLGAEDYPPYRRPMVSKELLAGTADQRRSRITADDFWVAHEIDLRTGVAVESIDPRHSRVRMADGNEIGYDSLLLATGARPRNLPGGGSAALTLRGQADVAAVRSVIAEGGSLIIVGGGLIGCEVAATARALGSRVTLLHAGTALLDRVAPEVIGEYFRKLHSDNEVEVITSVVLDHLDRARDGVTVTAADGRSWTAAGVLVAIGAVPDTELAITAGLQVDDGILVDERYRTSAPGVYAAGDAARRFDPRLGTHVREEQWNSAQTQGAAAAKNILGQDLVPGEVGWGWSIQYGLNLQFAGRIGPGDELVVHGTAGTADVTVYGQRAGRMVGAVAVGRPRDIHAARDRIARGSEAQHDSSTLRHPDPGD